MLQGARLTREQLGTTVPYLTTSIYSLAKNIYTVYCCSMYGMLIRLIKQSTQYNTVFKLWVLHTLVCQAYVSQIL